MNGSEHTRVADQALRPAPESFSGQVVTLEHESAVLAGNPLGDPLVRRHPVYLPPGYQDGQQRYPVLWCLAAYTNAGPGQVNWRNHGENLPQRLDRLIGTGSLPPVIVVFPDCYTSFGGNQYINSPAIGNYADYLITELIPAVDQTFCTVSEPAGRALFGKSSGGFGALHLSLAHPGHWAAAASHAGDVGFDRVYLRDFPVAADVLAGHGGDIERFVRAFWRTGQPSSAAFHCLMTLCLAASYSPDMNAPLGLRLPFDLHSCQLDESVWQRWLAFDPALRVAAEGEHLADLSGLWIDVGYRDQYFIYYGSRQLHAELERAGIEHHYEEFNGTHSGIDWRYDLSLPWLAARLKGG